MQVGASRRIGNDISHLMQQVINDEYVKVRDTILHHKENVDIIPPDIGLATLEIALVNAMCGEYTLSNCLLDIKRDCDCIILDCMTSLVMITINALASVDSVIIPVQRQFFSVKGLRQLLNTINRIKKQINPKLEIEGKIREERLEKGYTQEKLREKADSTGEYIG